MTSKGPSLMDDMPNFAWFEICRFVTPESVAIIIDMFYGQTGYTIQADDMYIILKTRNVLGAQP